MAKGSGILWLAVLILFASACGGPIAAPTQQASPVGSSVGEIATPTEPRPTETTEATEVVVAPTLDPTATPKCVPAWFSVFTVGYMPEFGLSEKDSTIENHFACNFVTYTWLDGTVLSGGISDDGKSFITCRYVKPNGVRLPCRLDIKPSLVGELYADGWVYNKQNNAYAARICLAENIDSYSKKCD